MRTLGFGAGMALSVLMAGCAAPLAVNEVTSIVPKTKSAVGTDVYAGRRTAGEQVPEFTGEHLLEVRTYTSEPGPLGDPVRGKEIAGAKCRVETTEFHADAVTPAKVRLPLYREKSSPLSVSCAHDAHKQAMTTVAAYNASSAERRQMMSTGASSGGLIGLAVGAVAAGVMEANADPKLDMYSYPAAHVVMTPTAAPATAPAKPEAKEQ